MNDFKQTQTKDNRCLSWLIVVALVLSGIAVGFGVFVYSQFLKIAIQNEENKTQLVSIQQLVENASKRSSELEVAVQDLKNSIIVKTDQSIPSDWRSFNISPMSLSFQYPSNLGSASIQMLAAVGGAYGPQTSIGNATEAMINFSDEQNLYVAFKRADFRIETFQDSGDELDSPEFMLPIAETTCEDLKKVYVVEFKPFENIENCEDITYNDHSAIIFHIQARSNTLNNPYEEKWISVYYTGQKQYPSIIFSARNGSNITPDTLKLILSSIK